MLEVASLTKTFTSPDAGQRPLTIVNVRNFAVAAGQHVALLGSSGSGKTTFLHLLAGILTPDSGAILYTLGGGKTNLAQLSEADRDQFRGRHIGYIFQTHHLLPGLTALENVLLGMSFTGRTADAGFARHLLTEVGLGERFHHKPSKLSLGQQQRVAVARALANRPQLVLADEPTGSLDAASAATTLELIQKLCRETHSALLLVTHDLAIAQRLEKQVRWEDISAAATPASVGAAR